MSSNARLLSAIALGTLLVAIGLISFVNLSSHRTYESAPMNSGTDSTLQSPSVAAGKLAANFTLKDLKGNDISLASLRGKVVFLNVWATWCAPCREEMPSIESLYKKFKGNNDFVVLAVSQDTDGSNVRPFVEQNHLQFTVLLDPRNEVGELYDVNGIPETFIIGRDGRIVAHHVGPYDWSNADIREALQELIKSKQG
ncbi:MAG TPA: redoxin domain-containing protein [Candidatus Sulfotelmatobacter sp.]|jgi:peroxiredoxin|nr:redoxin domain-containing protein [Candidatus Sulfotelmatobacter sp.]